MPGREEETASLLDAYPWDYLIGSIHYIGQRAIDDEPSLVEEVGVEEAWYRYYETLAAAARSGLFDVLGHPDLVKMYGPELNWDWSSVAGSLGPPARVEPDLEAAPLGEGDAVLLTQPGSHRLDAEPVPLSEELLDQLQWPVARAATATV